MRSSLRASFRRKHTSQSGSASVVDASVLMHALRSGSVGRLSQVFTGQNQNNVNRPLPDGQLPLHVAVDEGRVDVVRFLLEHNADVNQTDQAGWTALHHAVYKSRVPVVKVLLEYGADPSARAGHLLPSDLAMDCDDSMTDLLTQASSRHSPVVRKISNTSLGSNEVFLAEPEETGYALSPRQDVCQVAPPSSPVRSKEKLSRRRSFLSLSRESILSAFSSSTSPEHRVADNREKRSPRACAIVLAKTSPLRRVRTLHNVNKLSPQPDRPVLVPRQPFQETPRLALASVLNLV